ncbi:MAG: hypothetical protein Q8N63_08540, partial [Nanoarchaeota archaeon]|nr:hypothetical protein [Nanoarchaeota archaeon]
MAYKKYIYKEGKKFGPYYYESYRDKSGKVRKKYVGTSPPEKDLNRKKLVAPTKNFSIWLVPLFTLLIIFGFFVYAYSLEGNEISLQISGTGTAIFEVSKSVYGSVAKIVGLSIENTEQQLIAESENIEQPLETEITTGGEQAEQLGNEQQEIVEALPAEETAQPTESEEPSTVTENMTEIAETNETIPEIVTPTDTINITEPNVTEENITEITNITIIENITNITVPEIIETNVTNITLINETANITIENITEINETLANITLFNETEFNISSLNVTTQQYKAVINKPVKWLKKVKIENLREENLFLELPKQAENITIKTKAEIAEAEQEMQDYGESVAQTRRINLMTGQVIGGDLGKTGGISIRLWNWLKRLTVTGRVIEEQEIEEDITETPENKVVNVGNIAQREQENEMAIEYYTEAPTSEESEILEGKKVVISGPDEVSYTNVLAYTLLDKKVSINTPEEISLYWLEEVEEVAESQQETEEETIRIEENQIIEEKVTGPTTNETIINETVIEIESEQKTNSITAFAIDEQILVSDEINNLTDSQLLNNNTNEQQVSQIQTKTKKIIRQKINFTSYDLDEDGLIDYIEWNVEHLSNQTYEVIIGSAEKPAYNITSECSYETCHELQSGGKECNVVIGDCRFVNDEGTFKEFTD